MNLTRQMRREIGYNFFAISFWFGRGRYTFRSTYDAILDELEFATGGVYG